MIRNASIGETIYLQNGYGPKCVVKNVIRWKRFTLYHCKVVDARGHPTLTSKDSIARPAGEFSRNKKNKD